MKRDNSNGTYMYFQQYTIYHLSFVSLLCSRKCTKLLYNSRLTHSHHHQQKKGTKIQHINVYSLYKFSYRYFMKTHQTWLLPKTLYFSLDYILILPSSSCHHFTFHVVFCIRFHFTRQQLKIFLVQCKFLLLFTVAQQRQPKIFFLLNDEEIHSHL